MSREKQIDEMAKDVASTQTGTVKPDLTLTELGEVYKGEFILRIAKHLYNEGYRKSSEIAEEIFAEIAKITSLTHSWNEPIMYAKIDFEALKELKKKYTEEGK